VPGKIEKIVKPLPKGQVTIPAAIRKKLGIGRETYLKFVLDGDSFRGIPVKVKEMVKGKRAELTKEEKLKLVEDIARIGVKTRSWKRMKAIIVETHLV
jgi:AbrB family looped-hinge helix DNA binding protein